MPLPLHLRRPAGDPWERSVWGLDPIAEAPRRPGSRTTASERFALLRRVEAWLGSDDEGVPALVPCVDAPPWLSEARRVTTALAPGPEGQRFVIVLFAGPPNRPEGLAAELRRLGAHVIEVDVLIGGRLHDLTDTTPEGIGWYLLLRAAAGGAVDAVHIALPCEQYSPAPDAEHRVRDADHLDGLPAWHRATQTV